MRSPSRPGSRLVSLGSRALFLLCLAPALEAGNVLRVGAGQPYATVQDAVNAALLGDLVLVDPGTYPPFHVGAPGQGVKHLSIVASAASFTISPSPGSPEILVENVPAGLTVTIIGASIQYDDRLAPAVVVRNNAGAVRFSALNVTQTSFLNDATVSATVEVANTSPFWLTDSSIWSTNPQVGDTLNTLCVGGICNDGISGLQLTDSKGMIQNTRVRGYENSSTASVTGYGGDGLRLIGESATWLLRNEVGAGFAARFKGGDGIYGGHAIHQVRTPTSANLNQSCGSGVSPSWEPGRRLIVGQGKIGGFYGFNNDNGTVGTGGGPVAFMVPDHCGLDQENESSVQASLVPLGGNMVVKLRTRKARRFVLLISGTTQYQGAPGMAGRAMLLAHRRLVAAVGVTAADTVKTLSFPVLTDPGLIGLQITTQSAFGPLNGPLDSLGLPALAVIGP